MPLLRFLALFLFAAILAAPLPMHTSTCSAQAPGTADAADTAALTAAMQRRYESLESFEAAFSQTLVNAASGESRTRTGTIRFKRPSLIRWQTVTPEPELLVVGAQDVWAWYELEQTAYRYTVEQVLDSRTMLRFIAGKARLDEDFWVEDQGDDAGLRRLHLIPRKAEPSLVEATVWVDTGRTVMTRMELVDFFGNVNAVSLENLAFDVHIPAEVFAFAPPKDADVFDNRDKGAQGVENLGQ
ncbi:outer membrane lipoprotein carrier protein LolA [Desulfocurvus sp.]|jgi:outer membrane lipoprotein carrier protein|uniref:LolA family protein n=1 Tax=Desulfocurvus sp. TaxID=2871698 RepID=UPI0025B972E6|nr:outer membrane lipoprotein carrier protein LolA [Desulfocurvus sp.]MCK9239325.1 outer membrane lipoprotein carrier protein LolA [Desulfocurvus sp.]